MIIQLKIPDSVYERYAAHHPVNPEKAMQDQLIRFAELKPSERVLILQTADRERVEFLLGKHLENPNELILWLQEVLKVKMDGAEIPIPPETLAMIQSQATFYATDPKEFVLQKLSEAVNIAVNG